MSKFELELTLEESMRNWRSFASYHREKGLHIRLHLGRINQVVFSLNEFFELIEREFLTEFLCSSVIRKEGERNCPEAMHSAGKTIDCIPDYLARTLLNIPQRKSVVTALALRTFQKERNRRESAKQKRLEAYF
jgi:hypothetical protein